MGRIITPGEQGGADMFINAALKTFLQTTKSEGNAITLLRERLHDDATPLYLTAVESDHYELAAFKVEPEGLVRTQCFKVLCDSNLQPSGIEKVKLEQLSKESQVYVAEIKENLSGPKAEQHHGASPDDTPKAPSM